MWKLLFVRLLSWVTLSHPKHQGIFSKARWGPWSFSCCTKQTIVAGTKYRGARIMSYLIQVLGLRHDFFLKYKLLLEGNQFNPGTSLTWCIVILLSGAEPVMYNNYLLLMKISVCLWRLCCSKIPVWRTRQSSLKWEHTTIVAQQASQKSLSVVQSV